MRTLIHIDAATRLEVQRLAAPYLGVADCRMLTSAVRALLASRHPTRSIEVAHIVNEPDLWVPLIRLALIVDGELDQGMLITTPSPEPEFANDDAAPVARAA